MWAELIGLDMIDRGEIWDLSNEEGSSTEYVGRQLQKERGDGMVVGAFMLRIETQYHEVR